MCNSSDLSDFCVNFLNHLGLAGPGLTGLGEFTGLEGQGGVVLNIEFERVRVGHFWRIILTIFSLFSFCAFANIVEIKYL